MLQDYFIYTYYIIIFVLSCLEYHVHYNIVKYMKPDLTEKQKAYILSIKSSFIMCLVGFYFNYYYLLNGLNQEQFFINLDENNLLHFGKLAIIYFEAYLFMDLYIGNREYTQYMQSLSGNFHHTVYIGVNLLSLYTGLYPLYLLHMMSELPTFLMSIGAFDISLRNDNLFGVSFFLTRIVYHFILVIIFRQDKLLFVLGGLTLGLHLYWFYGWSKKYGKKMVNDINTFITRKNN